MNIPARIYLSNNDLIRFYNLVSNFEDVNKIEYATSTFSAIVMKLSEEEALILELVFGNNIAIVYRDVCGNPVNDN